MFKEGDIITGTIDSRENYSITTDKAVMKVKEVYHSKMLVEVLESDVCHNEIGAKFTVRQELFKHINNSVKKIT